MQQITSMLNYPLQTQQLILPDGTNLSIQFYFIPMQYGWFITNLTYGSFVLNGVRVVNSPNMLHQFRNQIPFGLACFSTNQNNRDPQFQQDFSSGANQLFLLSTAEVEQYTAYLNGG